MGEVVNIDIDQLITGQILKEALYDQSGVLLLAAGSRITAENIRQIKARGVSRVLLGADDARNASASRSADETNAGDRQEDQAALDEQIASLVQGGPPVVNSGPSLRHSVTRHGRAPFDPQFRSLAVKVAKQSEEAIKGVLAGAIAGRDVDGAAVADATSAEIKMLTGDLESTLSAAFESNADSDLAEQSLKNALLGMSISIELGLDLENTKAIGISGCLQNVGLTGLSESIRFPKRPLTISESLQLQKVPRQTVELLERVEGLPAVVRSVVYQIHERPDGSGYPAGLKGRSIHLFARALQVSNTYIEMTHATPHRRALTPYAAAVFLLQQAKSRKVDAEIVRNMLRVTSLYPIGSFVALSDGSIARTLRANGTEFTQPVVAIVIDSSGNAVDSTRDENLLDLRESDLEIVKALPTPGRDEAALAG